MATFALRWRKPEFRKIASGKHLLYKFCQSDKHLLY